MMHHRLVTAIALAFALCTAGEAVAAGFYLPGRGVKPLGRGGALVASGGGDPNSLWYNPANLAPTDDLLLTVDLALIDLFFEHTRAPRTLDNGEVIVYPTIRNEAPPKADPQILLAGPLPIDGMVWSFGLYAPYLSGHTFPEDGPQRYVLVDNDRSVLAFLHFAVAYQIGENLRVGAGFQNVPSQFELVAVGSGYTGLFGDPEDEDLDILTRITLTDLFAPGANAGIWLRIAPFLESGLSVQTPIRFRDRTAKLEARLPSHPEFQNAELVGDSLDGYLTFPPVARLGLRYVHPMFDVELAGVWEGWSVLDELVAAPNEVSVQNLPGLGSVPVGPLSIPMEWQDAFSVRLGGDVTAFERFTPRAGYVFETTAIPDHRYSVFLAESQKHVFSLGGSYAFDSLTLDAGLGYYYMVPRNITNSEWRQLNPTDDQGKVTLVVANGSYRQRYIAGGIGTTFRF